MNRQSFYSIYDSKAEAFLPPFLAANIATAKRLVLQAAVDPTHQFHQFAADYTLFEVGEWDENEGLLLPHDRGNVNCGNVRMILDHHQHNSGVQLDVEV